MGEGKFFVFEGIDGCGKTTLINGLKEKFNADGYDVSDHEPYGTTYGKMIRNYCNQNQYGLTNETIALLMYSSFIEFTDKIIKPALEQNKIVLVDRWYGSTIVYQGIEMDNQMFLANIHNSILPLLPKVDRYIYLDCSYEVSQNRLYGKKKDHFEKKGEEFYKKAAEWYKLSSELNPDTCLTYNGELPYNDVLEQVYNDLQDML